MTMRVLIAAGGTGGHIYPGIAVAKEIVARDPSSVVRFVGTARGLENRLVPQAGFELSIIESAGLVNMGLAQRLRGHRCLELGEHLAVAADGERRVQQQLRRLARNSSSRRTPRP